MHSNKTHVALSLTILILAFSATVKAESRVSEYKVKAAYLYQLPKFISWSTEVLPEGGDLFLCLLGKDPFKGGLQQVHLRQVRGHSLHVQYIKDLKQADNCHILFLTSKKDEQALLSQADFLAKQSILTIGESSNFASDGGMIALTLKNNRVVMEVNLTAAAAANIDMSANLLEIAAHVYGEGR